MVLIWNSRTVYDQNLVIRERLKLSKLVSAQTLYDSNFGHFIVERAQISVAKLAIAFFNVSTEIFIDLVLNSSSPDSIDFVLLL